MRRFPSAFFRKSYRFSYKNDGTFLSHALPEKPSSARPKLSAHTTTSAVRGRKKIIVIMGPTGCGKSKLSIDLASRFFPPSEIINSDKIQVYRGLDITTNKIPVPERKNVRHHLLGEFQSSDSHPEFTPSDFRFSASSVISQILSRRRIPFIVGGSNSFIYALLAKEFNPELDAFRESNSGEDSTFCEETRYSCCFLWVDVSLPVLNQHLTKRVDDMMESGMFEELAEYFENPKYNSASKCGLRKAIGVPEFESYFKRFHNNNSEGNEWTSNKEVEEEKRVAYDEAVRAIKDNTLLLAERQLGKILRLRDGAGWELNRVDATATFRAGFEGERRSVAANVWQREVVEPSMKIVKQFLME